MAVRTLVSDLLRMPGVWLPMSAGGGESVTRGEWEVGQSAEVGRVVEATELDEESPTSTIQYIHQAYKSLL